MRCWRSLPRIPSCSTEPLTHERRITAAEHGVLAVRQAKTDAKAVVDSRRPVPYTNEAWRLLNLPKTRPDTGKLGSRNLKLHAIKWILLASEG